MINEKFMRDFIVAQIPVCATKILEKNPFCFEKWRGYTCTDLDLAFICRIDVIYWWQQQARSAMSVAVITKSLRLKRVEPWMC